MFPRQTKRTEISEESCAMTRNASNYRATESEIRCPGLESIVGEAQRATGKERLLSN